MVRRGCGKSNSKNNLAIVGNNTAGLKNKQVSLKNLIGSLNVGILVLQETKLYIEGQIKIPDFRVFEKLRPQNGGGGLLIAAHVNFDPCLIQTEEDNPNLLTVQCTIGNSSVHVINGHSPQEDDSICDKIDFFSSLEKLILFVMCGDGCKQ